MYTTSIVLNIFSIVSNNAICNYIGWIDSNYEICEITDSLRLTIKSRSIMMVNYDTRFKWYQTSQTMLNCLIVSNTMNILLVFKYHRAQFWISGWTCIKTECFIGKSHGIQLSLKTLHISEIKIICSFQLGKNMLFSYSITHFSYNGFLLLELDCKCLR